MIYQMMWNFGQISFMIYNQILYYAKNSVFLVRVVLLSISWFMIM